MNRLIISSLLLLCALGAAAQGVVRGKVLDRKSNEPLEFINVLLTKQGETKIFKGAITDNSGAFRIDDIPYGSYTLSVSFTGYKELRRQLSITQQKAQHTLATLYLAEDTHTLQEVTVTGQRSEMKLEVDRKSFNVDQQISNAGGAASDVLENIPSVEVDQDGNISLRGNTSVEVWINGRSQGLTSDNRAEILQQLPAESIERIEVIDNPSAKFSAEGSAGIINIVLKKERKGGYYGSVQAGADTRKGANTSFNINYNSSLIDAYANIGYRHRHSEGGAISRQIYRDEGHPSSRYQNYDTRSDNQGNNLFTRYGLTWHMTGKDDLSYNGMTMFGGRHDESHTPYHYGYVGQDHDTQTMYRTSRTGDRARMFNAELNYRHTFSDTHFLDIVGSFNRWKSDQRNVYQDLTEVWDEDEDYSLTSPLSPLPSPSSPLTSYSYQSRPQYIRNRTWELKVDYENQLTKQLKLQAGYNGKFQKENTPQESFVDYTSLDGTAAEEDRDYYNRFVYKMDTHALYTTLTYNIGKFGIMGGLRGEYWRVDTKSYDWAADHQEVSGVEPPSGSSILSFKKDYFELFPSLFLSYQLTPTQQLQVNYTRRLRRPWGGQLNSFKNTRDATVISYGNPELTPEFSNSFSLNYLKQWTQHSLLVSAYYRPTTDVMQRITYQSSDDGLMYQTHFNVAKSTSTGLELTAKNKLFRILDLSTSANFYYYELDGFRFNIDNQTITGDGDHNFTWNARMQASLILPYDMSFQLTGRYRARQVITQGYRKAGYNIDLGFRKNFFQKKVTLALNCRDLLNSRRWKTYTATDDFTRDQENWRNGRSVRLTITYNFGNTKSKKRRPDQQGQDDDFDSQQQYNGSEE